MSGECLCVCALAIALSELTIVKIGIKYLLGLSIDFKVYEPPWFIYLSRYVNQGRLICLGRFNLLGSQ